MTKDINRGMEALWKYVRSLGRLNNMPGWIGLGERRQRDLAAALEPGLVTHRAHK